MCWTSVAWCGIQALIGFQLITVFNPGFDQKLSEAGSDCTSWFSCSSRLPLPSEMILDGVMVVSATSAVFAVFFVLWFVLARMAVLQRVLSRDALLRSRAGAGGSS